MAADSSDTVPDTTPESEEEKRGPPFPLLPVPHVDLKKIFSSWDQGVRFIGNNACCCSFTGLLIVTIIVVLGGVMLPMSVETDFESFMMTDVRSSLIKYSFDEAMLKRNSNSRRLQAESRRLQGAPRNLYTSQDLFLYYVLKPEFHGLKGGIFHSKAINEIAKFERRLRDLPEWHALCSRTANTSRGLCEPGMSFVRYKRPTLVSEQDDIVPVEIIIDGEGIEPVSTRTAVLLAEQQKMRNLLMPKATSFATDEDEPSSNYLRSAFRFRLPIGTSADSQEERRTIQAELDGEWATFFRQAIVPFVREGMDPDGNEEKMLDVLYDGSGIEEIEVKQALSADTHLAAMSMIYVLLYLFYHTRSPVLAVLGPVITIIAVPLSFVICAVVFGTTTLSFANFIAVFLVVGFGADVMLVYTDFWEASGKDIESYPDRLVWTYSHAIRSTTTTTGTTALAFLANLASVIRALRHFGFFMGLCIVLAWFLISFIYAPLLVVTTKYGLSFRRNTRAKKDARMTRYVRFLYRFRRSIFIIAVIASVVAIGIAAPQIKRHDGVPSLFPPEHNQNRLGEVDGNFSSSFSTMGYAFREPSKQEKICQSLDQDRKPAGCVIFWCDADSMDYTVDEPWKGEGECRCFRKQQEYCNPGIRFVGTSEMHKSQLSDEVRSYIGEYEGHSTRAMRIVDKGSEDMPTTLFQEWETGMVSLQTASRAEIHYSGGTNPCAEYLCFCRGAVCKMDSSWQAMSQPLKLSYRPPDPNDRRLQTKKPSQRIYVAFGLTAYTDTTLLAEREVGSAWSYRKGFDMSQPWVQRNIYAFCTQFPAKVKVKTAYCWMKNFREYATKETGRFPVRSSDFSRLANAFIKSGTSNTRGTRYVWKVGDEIKATYISVHVFMDKKNVDEVLGMMEIWDAHLNRYNSKAVKAARGAYHTAEAWVRAEASSQLLLSMLNTLLILFILAFVAMNLFTHSCLLALYVVLSTVSVLCGLCFFIVVINGWGFGLVEVIALIYFIGYALDYSLHIAYKYSDNAALKASPFVDTGSEASNIRLQRVEFALRSIGGAVFGSALTTIGASFFLLFCNLTLFRKLGAMCLVVSLLSVFVALLPLPASLMIFGPQKPGCRCLDIHEGPDSQFSSVSPAGTAISRE